MSTSDAPSQSQQQERSQQQTSQQRRRGSSGGRRSKKRGRAVAAAPAEEEEMVLLTERVAPDSERLRPSKRPVRLCSEDKASAVKLDERQLSASSRKGYRMVRATHGAHEGTWYFEVSIDSLGPTGAARLGWATRKGELLAPVGADEHSYAYRSTEGSKVHRGLRESYGEEYGEGDVVGCILHLPPGGRPIEKGPADVVKYKSSLFYLPDGPAQRDPRPLEGSFVAFTRNGRPQGRAYELLPESTYYPAVSLFTLPEQAPARVTVNFGESPFAHPPPAVGGPGGAQLAPRPVCELSGLVLANGAGASSAQMGTDAGASGAPSGSREEGPRNGAPSSSREEGPRSGEPSAGALAVAEHKRSDPGAAGTVNAERGSPAAGGEADGAPATAAAEGSAADAQDGSGAGGERG